MTTSRSKLTNKNNWPAPLVRAVELQQQAYRDSHTQHSDLSVTQLLDPPRMVELNRRHPRTGDVSGYMAAFRGNLLHSALEYAGETVPHYTVEERLYASVGDFVLSGMMDYHYIIEGTMTGVLGDYKTALCRNWAFLLKEDSDTVKKWTEQLNSNAWLASENDFAVDRLEVWCWFTDWSPTTAEKTDDYPDADWVRFEIPLWGRPAQKAFIEERMELHMKARETLPECTDEERWAQGGQWAVMRHGRKRAVRLFDTEQEANDFMTEDLKEWVERRPIVYNRCKNYCSAEWCCEQNVDTQQLIDRLKVTLA